MKSQLLHTPEGVRDLYESECEERFLIQDRIRNVFHTYGYRGIQTPSFEFFDIFNQERGSVASRHMFKFFDRDNNTMVLRPDFTPGIARCAAKYYENAKTPVRLCYTGSTFINNSSYQGRLKEMTQEGCELIGDSSVYADAELIALLIESILSSGLKDFQVEIGHIGFFQGLAAEAGLSKESEEKLRAVLRHKNLFLIDELLEGEQVSASVREAICRLPQIFGTAEILEKAKSLTGSAQALNAIAHLEEVYRLLTLYGVGQYVSFDLGVLSGLNYYTGMIFRAYTHDVGEPIAQGGRYDRLIGQFGSEKASIGFAITVDLLHQAIHRQKIAVPASKSGKSVIYDDTTVEYAIKLAKYFRNSGENVTLLTKTQAAAGKEEETDRFSETIVAGPEAMERFGVTL